VTATHIDLEVQAVFRKVSQKADLQISRNMNWFDIPGWSSLMNVRVFVALEDAFHISFQPDEIVILKNMNDLISLIEAKIKKAG
jgi:acyl carrier protein